MAIDIGKPALRASHKTPGASDWIGISIDLAGGARGTITIRLSPIVALKLAGALAKRSFCRIDKEVQKALSDLTCLIVDATRQAVPKDVGAIALPRMTTATDFSGAPLTPVLVIPVTTPAGKFVIEVSHPPMVAGSASGAVDASMTPATINESEVDTMLAQLLAKQ